MVSGKLDGPFQVGGVPHVSDNVKNALDHLVRGFHPPGVGHEIGKILEGGDHQEAGDQEKDYKKHHVKYGK